MIASHLLGDVLGNALKGVLDSGEKIVDTISSSFVSFNEELCNSLDDNSGCTALVAIFFPDSQDLSLGHLYVANIGDSLGVLISNNKHQLLSKSHTCLTESPQILERGGFVFSSRVNGILSVTRAFGDANLKSFLSAEPTIFYEKIPLSDNSSLRLLLACDGVYS